MKTWQDAYVEAQASCETDLPHKRIEAGIDAAVNFATAACAAGPWRYDVENIQDDALYLFAYPGGDQVLFGRVVKLDSQPYCWPFAVYNPPQEPKL